MHSKPQQDNEWCMVCYTCENMSTELDIEPFVGQDGHVNGHTIIFYQVL